MTFWCQKWDRCTQPPSAGTYWPHHLLRTSSIQPSTTDQKYAGSTLDRRMQQETRHQHRLTDQRGSHAFSCSPFTIHVRHFLPTFNIGILKSYSCKGDHPLQWETPRVEPPYTQTPLFTKPKLAQMIIALTLPSVQNFVRIYSLVASVRIREI